MTELKRLIRSKPKEATADFGEGDVVKAVFDASKITPAWMKEAQRRDEEQDAESLSKALCEVLISWDVLDEGAETRPSVGLLSVFSYPVLSGLLTAILKAAVPSSEEGNASSELSSSHPATSSEPASISSPNGVTSQSPAPSESLQPT